MERLKARGSVIFGCNISNLRFLDDFHSPIIILSQPQRFFRVMPLKPDACLQNPRQFYFFLVVLDPYIALKISVSALIGYCVAKIHNVLKLFNIRDAGTS